MNATAKWDTRGYQQIVAAEGRENRLAVRFDDGTEVVIEPDRLVPSGMIVADLKAVTFDPYEIIVPTTTEPVEISWSTIRALTDREYAKHLADAAKEQARQVGLRIRELREQRSLTGKELAERAGITPQSLSRIENGHHDVVYTTLQPILAAMGASVKDLVAASTKPTTLPSILKRLGKVGLDSDFVTRRLISQEMRDRLFHSADPDQQRASTEQLARRVSRIFGWSVASILGSDSLTMNPAIASTALFKAPKRTDKLRADAYTVYANYLAMTVLSAVHPVEAQPVPETAEEVRRVLLAKYHSVSFESLLRYTWDLGIPVVPLRDPGAFHGACWRVDGRSVIVLKQMTNAHARWLIDLGHELKHVGSHLRDNHPGIVEEQEIRPVFDPHSSLADWEWEANDFATNVVLAERAEDLVQQCVRLAKGSVERLKLAVQRVAAVEDVPVDVLANYVAWRLSLQGINWWGVANHLQVTEPSPWKIARDVLLEKVDFHRLTPENRELLLIAMEELENAGVGRPSG